MRLDPHDAIKRCSVEAFGPDAVVRVFGSRLDDHGRGGHIDLHVEVLEANRSIEASGQFRRLLDRWVGERDYDIVIAAKGSAVTVIDRKAIAEGIIL